MKNAEQLKAWLDGKRVRVRKESFDEWVVLASADSMGSVPRCFADLFEVEILPDPIKLRYRVAVMRGDDKGFFPYIVTGGYDINKDKDFVCWATDWQTVEVPQ